MYWNVFSKGVDLLCVLFVAAGLRFDGVSWSIIGAVSFGLLLLVNILWKLQEE